MSPASSEMVQRASGIAKRLASRVTGSRDAARPVGDAQADLDPWLVPAFGDELTRIENAIAGAGREGYREFRDLDDDLWALLLTREYQSFPGIREFLPGHPETHLQDIWNGTHGPALAAQSVCFYRKVKELLATHGGSDLADARILDFGCGWGRLTRMFAKDLEPGNLYGCDPVADILDICRDTRVPAELAQSDFLPEKLPFEEKFDLVFAFSVFTHISEAAHLASLNAIRDGLKPGGLFVVTIRPPSYLDLNPLMKPAVARLGPDPRAALEEARYVFVPHPTEGHPQYDDDAHDPMSYGETVITMPYVREKWTDGFELVDVGVLSGDMYQQTVTLRKT